jgi:RNA polymerase sigma-70 factor (ECF subfamily)
MASLEGWDLAGYREHLRERAKRLRKDSRVKVRFDESDLVQETFNRALGADKAPATEAGPKVHLAWLEAIQDHLLIDKHREHYAGKRDVRREEDFQSLQDALRESTIDGVQALPDSAPSPSEQAANNELEQRTEQAIEQLPPEQREVLRLRRQGLKFEEIAAQLNITKGVAQGRCRRGLETLRRLLRKGPEHD